jgi:methionyl-tRNA formyltransferase
MPLRILFFGTPAFAVPALAALMASPHPVVGLVTRPDRPRGRGQPVVPPPAKTTALARGLFVVQPDRLKDPATLESLRALTPDLGVVAAYGRLLPQPVIDVPRLGTINVHASLLPRWRGAAPIQRAILAGDTTTGVTIMRVVLALDAGPVLAQASTNIDPDETSPELEARLARLGAELLVTTVSRLATGVVAEIAQDERLVTYAPRLERAERRLDWARPARAVHNCIRGLQPWPLASSRLGDHRVIFHRSTVDHERPLEAPPGTIVSLDADAFSVAALPGAVRISRLQEEGRAIMSGRAYLNGRRSGVGDRFEPLRDVEP